MMGKYLDRNQGIGPIQEMMIKTAQSRHNKKDLIDEVNNCGIPIVAKILQIAREEINEVRWKRVYDLLDYGVVFVVWKFVFGSSFRPLFFSIMARLVREIDPAELDKYRKPYGAWKINHYAHRKKRVREKEKI